MVAWCPPCLGQPSLRTNRTLCSRIVPCSEGIVLIDVSEPGWPIVFINDAWENLTNFAKEDLGKGFWDFFAVGLVSIRWGHGHARARA